MSSHYERHPANAMQPDLSDGEKETLRKSILDHSQRVPIFVTRDGKIIDGWHRLNVCLEIAQDPLISVLSEVNHEPWRMASIITSRMRIRDSMNKNELCRAHIRVMRACGMKWAKPGRPPKKIARNLLTPRNVMRSVNREVKWVHSVACDPPISSRDPGISILRVKDILEKLRISRSTLHRMRRSGTFPAPIKLGCRCVGWHKSEVEAWIESSSHQARSRLVDLIPFTSGKI